MFGGFLLYVILEITFIKNAGVFGKQAKQDAHQIYLQFVAFVANGF